MSTPSEAGSTGADAPVTARRSRLVRWGYPLLGLALLALYLPTLARGPTFSDGPELVTAIYTLGVPHPTGYPLFVLLGHVFTRLLPLPIAPVLKVELFNALCAVGAALFTARGARELALLLQSRAAAPTPAHAGAGEGTEDADLCGLGAGFLLGITHLLWQQVRIPEVYPLHLFLVAWAGYLWIRFEVTRRETYIVAAALPMGLGLAHHVTMVYMLPAAALYLLVRKPSFFVAWLLYPVARLVRRRRPGFLASISFQRAWAFPLACLVGALPMLSYLYLIWANAHTTGIPWNDVRDWDQLVYHVSGKQYSGFLGGGTLESWWTRIRKLPGVFDRQFLPPGTVLFLVGLGVTMQRSARIGVFLLAVMLLNIGHGVYYSVGDYANYYLPALFSCAVFMGAGLWWALRAARARPAAMRRWLALAAAGVMLVAGGVAIVGYAQMTKRVPPLLAAGGGAYAGAPLALLGLAAIGAALSARRKARPAQAGEPGPWLLPGVLGAGFALTFVGTAISRVPQIGGQVEVGGSYGEEVSQAVPRGGLLLTQGDGFLFTMWYEHHVLGRGLDFATLDVGTLHAAWYQRYLRGRYPERCDPLAPGHLADAEGYRAMCGSFAQRMALGDKNAWFVMGQRSGGLAGLAALLRPAEADSAEAPRVVRGSEPGCEDRGYRSQHGDACKCWGYTPKKTSLAETCVESPEEGGVVPRAPVEIGIERLIRRHLDERPIYERNAVTFWVADRKLNPRGWVGPAYQRPSAEYALVNRGRVNQVVYTEDLAGLDACAEALRPVQLRQLTAPRPGAGEVPARPYQPSAWPILLTATYLGSSPEATDDDARREFAAGEAIHMRFDWFEQFHYDAAAEDRRGAPVRHGVRVCTFDPAGRRVGMETIISGKGERLPVLRTSAASAPGVYTVQACSLGEVGEGPAPEAAPCQRTVLEYTFTLRAGEGR